MFGRHSKEVQMQIDFSDEEIALLRELLRSAYGELREEIYKTEGTNFKQSLKARERTLQSLMQRVGA
jgi:hypothetical protein